MKNKELGIFVALLLVGLAVMYFMLRPRPAVPAETRRATVVPAARPVTSTSAVAAPAPAVVPITDRKTIDFSTGRPVVSQSAADLAEMARAEREMAEAAKGVTFGPAKPPPKK